MPAQNLEEFIRQESERLATACTSCGKCVDICPMTPYAKFTEPVTSTEVADGVKLVLRGEKGSASALAWISICNWSGTCIDACPEGIDPLMMVRLARISASGGLGGEPQIEVKNDLHYFTRLKMFAKLQLTEEEFRSWM
jgi:Fe-S oxidoreductase